MHNKKIIAYLEPDRPESRGYADNSRPGSPGYCLNSPPPISGNQFTPITHHEPTFESPHVQSYYTEITTVLDPKAATSLASDLQNLGTTGTLTKDISSFADKHQKALEKAKKSTLQNEYLQMETSSAGFEAILKRTIKEGFPTIENIDELSTQAARIAVNCLKTNATTKATIEAIIEHLVKNRVFDNGNSQIKTEIGRQFNELHDLHFSETRLLFQKIEGACASHYTAHIESSFSPEELEKTETVSIVQESFATTVDNALKTWFRENTLAGNKPTHEEFLEHHESIISAELAKLDPEVRGIIWDRDQSFQGRTRLEAALLWGIKNLESFSEST